MRKFLSILLITALILCMAGCMKERTVNAEGYRVIEFESSDVYIIIVDSETGVNYIVDNNYNRGGITPRYHADGTLYVSEVE